MELKDAKVADIDADVYYMDDVHHYVYSDIHVLLDAKPSRLFYYSGQWINMAVLENMFIDGVAKDGAITFKKDGERLIVHADGNSYNYI